MADPQPAAAGTLKPAAVQPAAGDTKPAADAVTIPAGMMAVRPAEGRAIRNPDRAMRLLRDDGELVPERGYWLRRAAAGDVVRISPEGWAKAEAARAEKVAADKAATEKAEADKAAAKA